jgi:uncharacterized membrane protein YfcA
LAFLPRCQATGSAVPTSVDSDSATREQGGVSLETAQIILLGILFVAFFVGTVLGFGTTIITMTFAAQMMTIEEILPVIAPLNVTLSFYLAIRHRHAILWSRLLKRILPAVGLGVPVGLVLFNLRNAQWLQLGFGLFVTAIASLQLRVSFTSPSGEGEPLGKVPSLGLLGLGGMMHGLFNTGGPLIVYVLGREIDDKSEFRSTIAAMFTVLTTVLVIDYIAVGLVTRETVKLSALALVPVIGGLYLGEIAHRRLDAKTFKRALWVLLFVGGAALATRAAMH